MTSISIHGVTFADLLLFVFFQWRVSLYLMSSQGLGLLLLVSNVNLCNLEQENTRLLLLFKENLDFAFARVLMEAAVTTWQATYCKLFPSLVTLAKLIITFSYECKDSENNLQRQMNVTLL